VTNSHGTVTIAGGGPAGLFLARLIKLQIPSSEVSVFESNAPDATFGFGVVFSDRTMEAFKAADPETCARLQAACTRWTDLEIRHSGQDLRYGGYGFSAISRITLLRILQEQAADAGAQLIFEKPLGIGDPLATEGIFVVADGVNSSFRSHYEKEFSTQVHSTDPRFIWFGTPAGFERVTFPFVNTRFGAFGAHAYPYQPGLSTFIVETDSVTWRAAGLDVSAREAAEPGHSDHYSQQLLQEVFKEHLDGMPLLVNNSKWAAFRTVRNRCWSYRNMVLLGDAAHTAHFSVGSGTKMAMEDAIALAQALREETSVTIAFRRYEEARRPAVERTQAWAAPSMRWWATFGNRLDMEPDQFGFHFVTRTGAISYAGLQRRDPQRIREVEAWFARCNPADRDGAGWHGTVLARPLSLGAVRLTHRIGVTAPVGCSIDAAHAATGAGAMGASLVVVDWGAGIPAGEDASHWQDAIQRMRRAGAEPMVAVRSGEEGARAARAVGARLVEYAPDASGEHGFDAPAEGSMGVLGVAHPPATASATERESFAQYCRARASAPGVLALHVRLPDCWLTESTWPRALETADLLRSQLRKPVLLDGPAGWALRDSKTDAGENWATRFHTAVLAGRIDLVIASPLPMGTAGRPCP
jgi:salicyloyl-CoA 5-hydroxylase